MAVLRIQSPVTAADSLRQDVGVRDVSCCLHKVLLYSAQKYTIENYTLQIGISSVYFELTKNNKGKR